MHRTTTSNSRAARPRDDRYDPWTDLYRNWPDYRVVIEPMPGDLLGQVREGGIIAICEDSSSRQQKCTLAHEILHLERGLDPCGQWQQREEAAIEAEVARRLIPLPALARALREAGGDHDRATLCTLLDVDRLILQARFDDLSAGERAGLRGMLRNQRELWSVA